MQRFAGRASFGTTLRPWLLAVSPLLLLCSVTTHAVRHAAVVNTPSCCTKPTLFPGYFPNQNLKSRVLYSASTVWNSSSTLDRSVESTAKGRERPRFRTAQPLARSPFVLVVPALSQSKEDDAVSNVLNMSANITAQYLTKVHQASTRSEEH